MPRKTHGGRELRFGARAASMRPRPDAAENLPDVLRDWADAEASMRPRPDAAENAQVREVGLDFPAASMRPRPDAAENLPLAGSTRGRPRLQ